MDPVRTSLLKWIRFFGPVLLTAALAGGARPQAPVQDTSHPPATTAKDLGQMSIEDLMSLQVTSGAKKGEPVQRTAAAIFVITSEDIRRSGATTLPDVLRLAPGLDVAQINGSTWAVSSRGFNDEFSNQMLVLVDGRTAYSPLYSGVFWEALDMLLADIDRIEVIRGPGAALWGTNAVNGVINIITKKAEQTQGGLLTAGVGNVEGGYGAAQYGGKIGSLGFYRFFTKGFAKSSYPGAPGEGPQDGWDLEHAGARVDLNLNTRDSLTMQGDIYQSAAQGTTSYTTSLNPLVSGLVPGIRNEAGGNLLAEWHRTLTPTSQFSLSAYIDDTNTRSSIIGLDVSTADVQFQHEFALGTRNDIVWGLDYRLIRIRTEGTVAASFSPADTFENLGSGFIQDEIEIVPTRLRLTLGARVQQDYSTGFEFQPDVRLLWNPNKQNAIWLAASRAYRGLTPADTSVQARIGAISSGSGLPVVTEALGNPNMTAIADIAFQAGYRTAITKTISVDFTSFLNHYTHLRGQDLGTPILETGSGAPFLLLPSTFNNKVSGETHGFEMSFTWKPILSWKLTAAYTLLDGEFRDSSIGPPPNPRAPINQSPGQQFNIRSAWNLPRHFELDTSLYRVAQVSTLVFVPGYFRVDARLGWNWGEHTEFSVVGQNLLTPQHFEFDNPNDLVQAAAVRRSFYGKFTWKFNLNPTK
ncbi:MAG TPA: TonB-dependent receptor [Candidatus Acidoferrales bacterium]|nr:TonB-dependent receptor [Candidatus Acidoferrales bacterium]